MHVAKKYAEVEVEVQGKLLHYQDLILHGSIVTTVQI